MAKKIQLYNPQGDLSVVQRAYEFARKAHRGQHRISGELFIFHPLEVAKILADLELDVITICAGLLHDVVEDTNYTIKDIEDNFGYEVALLVDGVTKLGRLEYKSKEEQQAENLRKMFLAMAEDIRVILIKLADRLHNMRTLKHLPQEKRKEKARETLEIFAPLAHRLGISKIQWELEDLALRYLEPQVYKELVELVSKKKEEREKEINLAIDVLRSKLEELGFNFEIQGRSKHFYSIYKKMKEQNKTFDQIYDLTAIRIIVNTIKDCYGVLGIVHTLWKPIPGRFKDYIAMPKPNMYQSLHTTVIGPKGEPLEIQIRTWEMHKTAEYGIAAHWKYKEGIKEVKDFEKKLSWLRELLEWQRDLKDAKEFMETIKIDLFTDEVFVFTPKGDVIDLPAGSTPIDFAYRIHTDVGHNCIGAKINGKIVPLNYQLKNGDIVEILTGSQPGGPSRDWLNIVKSSQARNKIRQWFKKEIREENIAKGREMLEKEVKRAGYFHKNLMKQEYIDAVLKKFNFNDVEDLFSSIGYGGITANQVLQKLLEEYRKHNKGKFRQEIEFPKKDDRHKKGRTLDKGVKVKGVDNLLVRFSRCCNPVPGDEIIGYITRGRGVSIHRKDCPNVKQHFDEKERLIEVEWDESRNASYSVEIQVSANDRGGLLSDVVNTINDLKTMIIAVNARTTRDRIALIDMTLEIKNKEHLQLIIQKLKRIKDVFKVNRILPN
ncbi:RelA/SpoT family protein [Koleobacter methoxysyntrophicus]|uniref:RelA/SpoT family protein n=1 Tax=Koleobacter methoxysyntrophicus TaxID=2751313 RepID=UPI0019D4FA1A|nr:bifunctional (p)ppGpp synthetase/guanosine-3',5'-bis(diphosphate) 3'-pyrophosphohydrolase [Koleobacter methoxysyntrophicus]